MVEPADPPPPFSPWSPRLCLWHWLLARAALVFACVLALRSPDGLVSSPFHPTTLACAHLVVLGFLATQVLGAFQLVAPLVLRVPLRAGWRAVVLLVAIALAASGVAAHMALGTYSGVAWSGGLLLAALVLVVPGWTYALAIAPAPAPIRAGAAVALLCLLLTACLGMALAADRTQAILPGGHLRALVGHAHLGSGGFVLLMVVSLGQRLLPIALPSTPPARWLCWLSVLAVAIGALGLGLSMPCAGWSAGVFAPVLALGVVAFLASVAVMVRRRQSAVRDGPRLAPARLLLATAVGSLALAVLLGLMLACDGVRGPGAMTTYGVLALLGGFGSLALALGFYLVPLAGWHAVRRAWPGPSGPLPRPPRLAAVRGLAWTTALAWPAGVCGLAIASWRGDPVLATAAIGALMVAVLADLAQVVATWRRRWPIARG